jgi:uncharacterized protein YbjT (DUF2867 family)
VGCGCRGRALARELIAGGHAVRGTTRFEAGRAAIAAAGAEPRVGDPDRIGTLTPALDAVTIVCWLLGSAHAEPDVAALHGSRLRSLCERLVDTTVRGLVYEAGGTVDPELLAGGAAIVHEAHRTWEIPLRVVYADPGEHVVWLRAMRNAVTSLLDP